MPGKVEQDFVALADAALEGVEGTPQALAPEVAGRADLKTGLGEHFADQARIVARVLDFGYGLVASPPAAD